MYCTTLFTMAGCVLLDYLIAFTALGTACVFAKPFHNNTLGVIVSTGAVGLIRYLCSFLSGILIWGGYAPEDMPVWLYSLTYNASYMIPEIIITCVATAIVVGIMRSTGKKAFAS